MTIAQLEALLALEAAATPGEWEVGGPWPSISVIHVIDYGSTSGPDPEPPTCEAIAMLHVGFDERGKMLAEHPGRAQQLADAALIVAACNALRALAEELREARRVLMEWHEADDATNGATRGDAIWDRYRIATSAKRALAARIAREEAAARGEGK